MKSINKFFLVIFLSTLVSTAFAASSTMTFFGRNGHVAEIPVMVEEAPDTIPCEIAGILYAERQAKRRMLIETRFDIHSLYIPEDDAIERKDEILNLLLNI